VAPLVDAAIVMESFAVALLFRFSGQGMTLFWGTFSPFTIFAPLVFVLLLYESGVYKSGVYQSTLRYSGIYQEAGAEPLVVPRWVLRVASASAIAAGVLCIGESAVDEVLGLRPVPLSVILFGALLAYVQLVAVRLLPQVIRILSARQAFFRMRDIAQTFLKRPGVILLVVVGLVGPTLGFSLSQPAVYEASAKLVVREGQKTGVNQAPLRPILPTVTDAIDQRPVAEEVIQRLGLRMKPAELVENLSVEQEGRTGLIQLSYKDADPERAQRIVNTVGVVSSERVTEAIERAANDITVTMRDDASVPTNPASPDPVRNVALALILGLMVAPVLAILMDERASRS
jgi:capsular polysaccharide biosynthesis protein